MMLTDPGREAKRRRTIAASVEAYWQDVYKLVNDNGMDFKEARDFVRRRQERARNARRVRKPYERRKKASDV